MNIQLKAPFELDTAARKLVDRAHRFLVAIQQPGFWARAAREGYTTAENRLGWRLTTVAGGHDTSVEANLAATEIHAADAVVAAAQNRQIKEIDGFENIWLPRTRAIIQRVVPAERSDAFEAAFFLNLEQQPLGPGVIDSVATFIKRVEGLDGADDADAKRVRKTLKERGLDEEHLAAVKKTVAAARDANKFAPTPAPEAVAAAEAQDAERAKAVRELRAWYNDWATTLRSVFNTREQIRLGLTESKKTAAAKKKKKKSAAPTSPASPVTTPAPSAAASPDASPDDGE